MKNLLLLFLLLFTSVVAAVAQPRHVGVLINGQFETSNGGNGSIVGIEGQNVHPFRVGKDQFKVVSNITATVDKKVYRNQFGGAVRASSLVRWHDRTTGMVFLQGGVGVGGILFPDTPEQDDGYVKYAALPIAGAGFSWNDPKFSVVTDYQFHFKRRLLAQRNLSDFKNRIVDGWTSGQSVGVAATWNLGENYLLLFNTTGGWYTYQRNPGVYGNTLGSVVHKTKALEISIGIGKKY